MADVGRPSVYTPEIAERICASLEAGRSLNRICKAEDMPAESTVRLWDKEDREGFSAKYARSREVGYLRLADELLDIADEGTNDWMASNDPENPGYRLNGEHIARSRLRVDTRKWMLAKMLPKVFGEKLTHAGDADNPVVVRQRIERVIVDAPNPDRESVPAPA